MWSKKHKQKREGMHAERAVTSVTWQRADWTEGNCEGIHTERTTATVTGKRADWLTARDRGDRAN